MKKKSLGLILLTFFALSFGFLSCAQDANNNDKTNPFIGIWSGEVDDGYNDSYTVSIVFSEKTFTAYDDGVITMIGEYTYNGNVATLFYAGETFSIVINDGGFYAWSIWLEKQ